MNAKKAQELANGASGCEELREKFRCGKITSFGEMGKRVFVKPLSGELVTFYRVDERAFRTHFKCQKVCDLMVHREPGSTAGSEVIAYIELKGRDADSAVKQLSETIDSTRSCLRKTRPTATLRALIVMRGSAPRNANRLRKKFESDTGIVLNVKQTNGKHDLGPWLRQG